MDHSFEHFDHQADIGIRGFGADINEAFANCGYALSAVICDPQKVEPLELVTIECREDDLDDLLFDWLSQLLTQMDVTSMLFSRFDVQIDNGLLKAILYGEKADPEKHDISVQVKAATYTLLKVQQDTAGQWTAQCVVDV